MAGLPNEVAASESPSAAPATCRRAGVPGEAAISSAFIDLVYTSDAKRAAPRAVFGHMNAKRRTDYLEHPAFEPFRRPLRDSILSAWPTFGISVGINDKGRFRALIDAGQTPATRMRNPRTGVANIYVTAVNIADFHRRFVTACTLAAGAGRAVTDFCADLKRAGVSVFSPEGHKC